MDKTRITEIFAELVKIDSPSFGERKMADRIKERIRSMGYVIQEDHAGTYYGGSAGNLFVKIPGNLPGGPILLCSHLDTVEPSKKKIPVFHPDGRITSDGMTVLGADDLAGVTQILTAVQEVTERKIPHRSLELLFPIGEEMYDKGTNVFDFSKVTSRQAYILDMSGAVGAAALQAPTILSFTVRVQGKASHAGFVPEQGIHAIAAMCQAITRIRQGHIDEDSTLNIGTIQGGTATNIVPEQCMVTGEIRSWSHDRALAILEEMSDIFCEEGKKAGAEAVVEHEVGVYAYRISETETAVREFQAACERLHLPGTLTSTFGGSDNNNFARFGIPGIVLSCGMEQVHSVREYIKTEELVRGAELVLDLITH